MYTTTCVSIHASDAIESHINTCVAHLVSGHPHRMSHTSPLSAECCTFAVDECLERARNCVCGMDQYTQHCHDTAACTFRTRTCTHVHVHTSHVNSHRLFWSGVYRTSTGPVDSGRSPRTCGMTEPSPGTHHHTCHDQHTSDTRSHQKRVSSTHVIH